MLVLLVFFLLGVPFSSQEIEEIPVQDKDEHELFIQTQSSKEYLITLPFAFKLIVKVEEVDVKSEYGDYLLIKRGPDFETAATGIALTEKGKPENPLLISADKIYIKLFVGDSGGKSIIRKFKLKYTASGTAKITTTETPTSTTTWPTPGPHDKIHYKAHLYGLRDIDYMDKANVDKLEKAIAKMAAAYCRDQAMPVLQAIEQKNVIIADLIRCPYSWPDSEKCVIVNFAVPVVMKEDYVGYQLLAKHLEVMWERYEDELIKYGFKNYKIPDLDTEMVYWDVTIACLVVSFVVLIIIIVLIMLCKPSWLYKLLGRVNKPGDREFVIPTEERDSCVPNEDEFNKFKASARIS